MNQNEEYTKVLIDSDFFNHFTESNPDGELFLEFMEANKFKPLFHQFVYEKELPFSKTANKLVKSGKIEILQFEDIILNDIYENLYQNDFNSLYKRLNQKKLPKGATYKAYHASKQNLGEIHSTIAASFLGIQYIMSNDNKAKNILNNYAETSGQNIKIYSIAEFLTHTVKTVGTLGYSFKKIRKKFKTSALNNKKGENYAKLKDSWTEAVHNESE